jgi:nucleoside-diphosphate-sugar epimerase
LNVLVTGGGGFLGQAIVRQLRAAGHAVTAAGRSRYPELEADGVRTLQLDVRDAIATRRAVAGHDTVIHAAARAGVWGPRSEYQRINVDGTQHVIDACRAAGVERLVYTSSPSVAFDGRDHENAGPELPYPPRYEAIYPETKAAAERLVLAANGPRLATTALRPHLIWGPGDPHLLPRVFERARRGRLRIVGHGQNRVGVSFVENAAAAHVQAALALQVDSGAAGRAFFVHDPEPVALWPWLNTLLEAVGLHRVEKRVPLRAARLAGSLLESAWSMLRLPGEPPMTRFVAAQLASSHWYDLQPARDAFGYAPPVSAADAFDRTVRFWRAETSRRAA